MIPVELRVTNFRSVRGTQVFTFPRAPGLYFMEGVNVAEPRLGANGSGKTTLWEALTWCWFGKTSRGLKAGDVCNWDAGKGTIVEFDFIQDEDVACVWTLTRTWSPNSWTLRHAAEFITDEAVIDLAKEKDNIALSWLGIDFDQWLNCVLTAQNQPMFLDMKREAQAALFSKVVGADDWLDYSSKAGKFAAEQDRQIREMERELAGLEGELEATGRRDYREESATWETKTQRMLKDLEGAHADLIRTRKRLVIEVADATDKEDKVRQAFKDAEIDRNLQMKFDALKAEEELISINLAKRQTERDGLHAQLDKLEKDECPTCGQHLNASRRSAIIRGAEAELRNVNETIEVCKTHHRKAGIEREDAASVLRVQHAKYDARRADLDDAQRAAGNARRALEQCDRDLDRAEEDWDRLKEERNPYADMEERALTDARKLQGRIDALRDRLDSASSKHALYGFWVRGFKDLRLTKIDEALDELEIEANSGIDALGLLDWELQFRVDRENKSGKLERGFNCFVASPHNDAPVPWEAWSGGEGQRLRLAGTMGLADLIRGRTGASIPLEVWDEPTNGLSPGGIRDLLECLRERAIRESRCIWLVDHKSHDFGGFAGGAVVTKTDRGTTFSASGV